MCGSCNGLASCPEWHAIGSSLIPPIQMHVYFLDNTEEFMQIFNLALWTYIWVVPLP